MQDPHAGTLIHVPEGRSQATGEFFRRASYMSRGCNTARQYRLRFRMASAGAGNFPMLIRGVWILLVIISRQRRSALLSFFRKPAGSGQEKALGGTGGRRPQRHQRSGAAARNEGVLVPGLRAAGVVPRKWLGCREVIIKTIIFFMFVIMELMHACYKEDDYD